MTTNEKKSWTVTLMDADDGTDDLIMPFTDEILSEVGWKEGDILQWVIEEDGRIILRKL